MTFKWRYPEQVPELLLCYICCNAIHKSVQCTQCQHDVCDLCYSKIKPPKPCPQCRKPLPANSILPISRNQKHLLDTQFVVCKVCDFTMRYETFSKHIGSGECRHNREQWCEMSTCLEKLHYCSASIYGCEFHGTIDELQPHELFQCHYLAYEKAWLSLHHLHFQLFDKSLFASNVQNAHIVVFDARHNLRTQGKLKLIVGRKGIVHLNEVESLVDMLLVIPRFQFSNVRVDSPHTQSFPDSPANGCSISRRSTA